MTIIRCSSADRVLECGASLDGGSYKPNNPDAIEGQAAHAVMPEAITGRGPTPDEIAAQFGVDSDTLWSLRSRALRVWGDLAQWFPDPRCEHAMSNELGVNIMLRGTSDLVSIVGRAVLDFKFGWQPSTHTGQIKSYAWLLRKEHGMPECGYILGVEVWVRSGTYEVHKFTDEDLDRLRLDLIEQVKHPEQFGPSLHACRYCSRQLSCPARAEWLRSGVTALALVADNQLITRELVADLYDQRRMLGGAIARYDDILRGMLAEGPLTTTDGRTLALEEQQQDSIRTSKAMRVLRQEWRLTAAEADVAVSITKGGIEKVMKARAPKRQGAKYMRTAMKRLREAGAVDKTTRQQITITKK